MIFLVISWVFLLIAAAIGIFHLRNYHVSQKKKSMDYSVVSSTLSEKEKLIIYDLERAREKHLALND